MASHAKLVIILLSLLKLNSAYSQDLFNNVQQHKTIQRFYQHYATLYSRDLFTTVYPAQSQMTFGSSQMMAPSAFSLEFRGGMITRYPSRINNKAYDELDTFKNIQSFVSINGTPSKLKFRQYNEGYVPDERIYFTLLDENQLPLNSTINGRDSVRWKLPSFSQLGLNEKIAPRFNATLRWAPGYAFEAGGTYLLYNSTNENETGFATTNRNRFYCIYLAHDFLYWWQKYHYQGWHVTGYYQISNWNQSINLTQNVKFYNDYTLRNNQLTTYNFTNSLSRIDLYNRTLTYGLKLGKSWHNAEAFLDLNYLFNTGGLSDDGYVVAYIDEKPFDANNGLKIRRYRNWIRSDYVSTRLWNVGAGGVIGQKNIRVGAQYNILSNGTHQGSVVVKYVFLDNNFHPWQKNAPNVEYFDPNKKKIQRKTVIIERDEPED